MKRFLLGQLCMNGDCLYATILARQIKHDHPGSHLTWAVSSACRSMIENNPDVDDIWEIPAYKRYEQEATWYLFENVAMRRQQAGEFDRIYLPQLWPNGMHNFDGTIRPSMLRVYCKPITVPIQCILNLRPEEISRVEAFAREHELHKYRHRLIFESNSMSGQSFFNPHMAEFIAEMVVMQEHDACVMLASNDPVKSTMKGVIDASRLSIREIGALAKHATLFVGSASGLTVVTQSTAGQRLPMIQLLSGDKSVFASFVHDHRYWGLPDDDMIELVDVPQSMVIRCIRDALNGGIEAARQKHHMEIDLTFDYYLSNMREQLLSKNRYIDAMQSLSITAARYGWLPDLLAIAIYNVIPGLLRDPRTDLTEIRLKAEAFAQDVTARWREIGG
ncbi:MAG: hypothetical protein EPN26_07325 [Rhodospirillales bacterium]|nr:MAG: hypothetical protein EPN26_07325 [Rhodospirillales bacterium]